ncbi:MAG TPA: type IV pilus assembly protein PilM [Jatrophihabitans sp.]|nr:type IV pilus assembly protein PilM [Jatrophihabitans sp.]
MKHRQIGNPKIGIVNPDGHAIGIDLGATSVRAAILAHGTTAGRPSVSVHGIGHVDLPVGAVVNGVVCDQNAVTAALKRLWADNRFECRNVILGITNQQVVVRPLEMPQLPPEQIAKALPFKAREVVPLPLDQALIDWIPLGESDSSEMVPGLLIATPRQPVLAAVQAIEKAGLQVARVDLSSFAALRAIADESCGVEAVVDIGAHMTNIVIHNHGVPKVVRAVTRGSQELTERIMDATGLEPDRAEEAKRLQGLTASNRNFIDIITEGLRPLLAEIRSSIHYFGATEGGATVQRVSLTGGGSALPGLAQLLGEHLSIQTDVVAPMQHIRNRLASKEIQKEDTELSATAVALGLAMGAAA